ncbi:MAG TPA: diguanylate cyclase [Thermoanaerobaculia bacterium]|nr:diguanylate cyclase [Thermoanaerobaculia bacterium]
MRKFLGRRRSDSGPVTLPQSMTALVVDDETSYRTYLTSLAEKVGFRCDAAADGAAARSMFANARYDLLVVNIETTGCNVLELIAEVRGDDLTKNVYTILVASNQDAEQKISALAAGYDDILLKSESELEIVAKLVASRRIITRQHTFDDVVRDLYGLASRDELTGVFNRRFLMSETEILLRQGAAVTVVLFDLDKFKNVNDTFGHLVGDRVLRDIGALFQRRTRPEDMVARYGGDEFVMVVTGEPFYIVEQVADRLLAEIRKLEWTVGPDQFSIGATVGLGSSHFLRDATLPQLLESADRELYKKKTAKQAPSTPGDDRVMPLPNRVEERA